jgi:hypothetical protein
MIGFIVPYAFRTQDYRQLQRYSYSTHFQFTVAHVLGFSVLTSHSWQRIYHSLTVILTHVKFSWHGLILFLLFLLNHLGLPSPELGPILFRRLYCTPTTASFGTRLSYNYFTRTTRKTACIVDEACLPRPCLSIDVLLFRAFVSAGMCLASRCLAMGIHVTICLIIIIIGKIAFFEL